VLRFAVNRVAGKALGDMLSATFRRVLLMVREDIDTARAMGVSQPLWKTHTATHTTCLILEIQRRAIVGSTADISHLQRATPTNCVLPPTEHADPTAHEKAGRCC
jgi:hypothetical protein